LNLRAGLARAEDDVEDEGMDVEGEDQESETSVTGEEEAVEQTGPGASPDADTTILFTAPVGSSNLGEFIIKYNSLYIV